MLASNPACCLPVPMLCLLRMVATSRPPISYTFSVTTEGWASTNGKTVFPFVLAHPSVVTLKVYDVGGREVATILSRQSMGMGRQQAEFDASMLSSGVYLYRLIAEPAEGDRAGEGFEGVRKMLLLR